MPELYSPVAAVLMPGRHGAVLPAGPGVTLSEGSAGGIVQLAGWSNFEAAARRVTTALGFVDAGDFRTARTVNGIRLFRTAPDRLLLTGIDGTGLPADRPGDEDLAVLDLSHARRVITIDGPAAEDVMARMAAVDFRRSAFPVNAFAQTGIHHVGVIVHRLTETRFDVLTPVTLTRSIWEAFELNARSFGFIIEARVNGAQQGDASA